jgi:hypothetical protein
MANPPTFRMYQSVGQSIPNTTNTTFTLDTSEWDSDSGRSGVSPYGYTIPVGMGGRWDFRWGVSWNSNTTGIRKGMVFKNGTEVQSLLFDTSTNSGDVYAVIGTSSAPCSAGDVITLVGFQNCGGPLTTQADSQYASFLEGWLASQGSP